MQILHLSDVSQVEHDTLPFIKIDIVSLKCYQLARRCLLFVFFLLLQVLYFIFFGFCDVQTEVQFVDLAENDVAETITGGLL